MAPNVCILSTCFSKSFKNEMPMLPKNLVLSKSMDFVKNLHTTTKENMIFSLLVTSHSKNIHSSDKQLQKFWLILKFGKPATFLFIYN